MRLNSILLAQHRPQKGICCSYLLLWPLLWLQNFSHPMQRQHKSFRSFHNTWEGPFTWYHCTEYWERVLTGWWRSMHWAFSGWARARFTIVLFPGQHCCWVSPGGIYVLPSAVCKDLPKKADPNCNLLWRFGSVCCCCCYICMSWKKSAVLKI